MARKHIPPSRRRYESKNPVISFRVPRAALEKLRQLQKKTGLSLSKLVQRELGPYAKSTEEAYRKGFANGYGRFRLLCPKCGKWMEFDIKSEPKAKEFLEKAFADGGWAHSACLRAAHQG